MKYWVYKESRILGPFDKEGVSGLPGVDEGTLVCEGDPAASSWVPAGSVGLVSPGSDTLGLDDLPSAAGLFDQLQIDAAGLVGDDDFPGALAQDLFQDADYKKGFSDLLSAGTLSADDETRRAREKISELTVQMEHLYRHISQLEAGHTDLARRLAEKDILLRGLAAGGALPASDVAATPETVSPKSFQSPFQPPPPVLPPAPADTTPAAPSDWAQTAGAAGPLPAIFGDAEAPSKLVVPGLPTPPSAPELPEIPAPAPKTQGFGRPKSFKVVPTAKSFKVVDAASAPPPAPSLPAPEFTVPPEPVAAAPAAPPPPMPAIEPIAPPPPPPPPAPEPVVVAPPAPTPAPIDFAPPAASPFAPPAPAEPTPAPPPNTLSRSEATPVPDLGATQAAPFGETAPPPATMARRGVAAEPAPEEPVDVGAAARFAKPAPPETAQPKPARSNKKFLIAGGVLLSLLLGVAVIFMRQPKDDLKQMAALDDGKSPVGLPVDDSIQAPPIVKPKVAEPEPLPAPPPGPSAENEAAIAAVKDFPLDGGRGTVGRWLEYSYTASPGAGNEEWNASTTAENTTLVEYRFVPAPGGSGKGALYLFELDGIGLVIGKNLEARQMLAGAPPAETAPVKKAAPKKKKAVKRSPAAEEPRELPQLPLPDSGELRPPAEDDGSFGSDTINSGI